MKKILVILFFVSSQFVANVAYACNDGDANCNGFLKDPDKKLCAVGKSWMDGGYDFQLPTGEANIAKTGLQFQCRTTKDPARQVHVSYTTSGINLSKGLSLCFDGFQTALNDAGQYISAGSVVVKEVCCPKSHPYLADALFSQCRKTSAVTSEKAQGLVADNNIVLTVNPDKWTFSVSSGYFEEGKLSAYSCNSGCAIKGGIGTTSYIDSDKYLRFLRADEINPDNWCIPNYADRKYYLAEDSCKKLPGSADDKCVCMNGASISMQLFETVGEAGVAIVNQCAGLPGDQSQQCVSCIMKNYRKDDATGKIVNDTYYTFSSALGCVDTRTGGIVNRLIQIGLGIGSGIAILRIIQAAYLRQTNDPGKIQEGNEIMVATFLAIAVLVGAVVMLEIIGVSVLRIFTPAEFASLLGQ